MGHSNFRGHTHTQEAKRRISESKKGCRVWNKGLSADEEQREKLREIGRLGAQRRWEGHTPKPKPGRRSGENRTKEELAYAKSLGLQKKRFTNQRYKARKRKAPGSHTFTEWLELKHRYNNMCLCCKRFEPEIKLTEDHIVPLILGGSDDIANIQPLCASCNTRKFTKAVCFLRSPDELVSQSMDSEGSVNNNLWQQQ